MIKFRWQSESPLGATVSFTSLQDFKALYKCCIIIIITGIVYRIRHYWEIRNVVYGHKLKSAAHTDLQDGDIGKTCLGGGMH